MMDKSNPMDWVFFLFLFQFFGMMWLLAAIDGTHHFVRISAAKRKFALCIGMLVIWGLYITVWISYGHSPIDMWKGCEAWWNLESGDFGASKIFAIGGWWMLLSPIMAIVAILNIRRAKRREEQATIVAMSL